LEERKSIVVGVIVVPLEALGVVEDDVPGQGVVSVNDVGQKDHGLATLIHGHSQLSLVVVDNVNVLLPFGKVFVEPRHILVLHASHHHLDSIILEI
jgi:hypothetical protein